MAMPVMESERTIEIVVTPDVREFFMDQMTHAGFQSGQGGFQALGRMLAARMTASRVLRLSPEEFKRLVRYANDYGDGGVQQRLRKIIVSWVTQHMDQLV